MHPGQIFQTISDKEGRLADTISQSAHLEFLRTKTTFNRYDGGKQYSQSGDQKIKRFQDYGSVAN